MKYAVYQIENEILEFHNSLIGKEALYLNGQNVSEKFSFWGTEHYFKINDDQYSIRPYLSFTAPFGVSFKIHKNGIPFNAYNRLSKKNKWARVLGTVFFLIVGFALGFSFIKFIL